MTTIIAERIATVPGPGRPEYQTRVRADDRRRAARLTPVPECEPPLDSAPPVPMTDHTVAPVTDRAIVDTARTTTTAYRPPATGATVPGTPTRSGHGEGNRAATQPAPSSYRRWAPAHPCGPTPEPAPRSVSRTEPRRHAGVETIRPVRIVDDAVPMWDHDSDMAVTPTSTTALPPALDSASMLARALLEGMAGRRELTQLRRHCAPNVFAGLLDQPVLGRGRSVQLVSVWACEPRDGCAEVSAIFQSCGRVRAMALHLQGLDGAWRVTALQLG